MEKLHSDVIKHEHNVPDGFHRKNNNSGDKPLDLDVKQEVCVKSENYVHKTTQIGRVNMRPTSIPTMLTHEMKTGNIAMPNHPHLPPGEYGNVAVCCNTNYGVPFLSMQQCGASSVSGNSVNGNTAIGYTSATMDLSALYSNGLFPVQNGVVAPSISPSFVGEESAGAARNGAENKNDERHTCRMCQKTFNNKHNLNKHINLHTGTETFACTVCQKKFSEKGNLTKHMNIHTGTKTYTCNVCGKTFYWLSSLSKHKSIHSGTGEKYACTVCEKLFSEKGNLTKHMNIHTGNKTFSCEICEKVFYWKGSLTMHRMIHTGDKLYSCGHCNRKFRWRTSYNKHVHAHLDIQINKHVHAHLDIDTCSEKVLGT